MAVFICLYASNDDHHSIHPWIFNRPGWSQLQSENHSAIGLKYLYPMVKHEILSMPCILKSSVGVRRMNVVTFGNIYEH